MVRYDWNFEKVSCSRTHVETLNVRQPGTGAGSHFDIVYLDMYRLLNVLHCELRIVTAIPQINVNKKLRIKKKKCI